MLRPHWGRGAALQCPLQDAGIKLPVRGFFQLKLLGTEEFKIKAQLLIQLKLDESMPTSFDYCECRVPFFKRGQIMVTESNPTIGSVAIDTDTNEPVIHI